ncbi:MAG: hypothetical protein AB8U53_05925 [Rickettsia aeschlimannii]
MEDLISQGANKYKALEFALKNNNAQAENIYLIILRLNLIPA